MTSESQSEAEVRRLAQRLQVLCEASMAFADAALDYDQLMRTVARRVVEQIGDFCQVRVLSGDGSELVSVALHDSDPRAAELFERAVHAVPLAVDDQELTRTVMESGEPLLIENVDPERLSHTLKPEFRPLVERYMPTSLILVPLKARSRSIGLLYVARRGPDRLNEHDLELGCDLAQRAAIAIENARLYRELERRATALERSEQRFATTLSGIADAVIATDESGLVTFMNPHAERLTGYANEQARGQPLDQIFELRTAISNTRIDPLHMPATSRNGNDPSEQVVLVSRRGERVPVGSTASGVEFADGSNAGTVIMFRDASEMLASTGRRRFLAEASAILLSSLDYELTLGRVARLAVPVVADWCVLDLVDDEGAIERVAIAHIDPDKLQLAREYQKRYPPEANEPAGVGRVIRTGEPELVTEIEPEQLAFVRDPEQRRIIESLGLRSYVIVPLVARGRILGALTCITAESERRYRERDLELLQELAGRVAYAVDNSRLFKLSQEAVAARDEFLSIASHELRTPLTPLGLQLEMLEQSLKRAPAANGSLKKLEIARRQVDRLARLVEGLLDVSRIATGRLRLDPERSDLEEIVKNVVFEHRELALRAHCSLELASEGPLLGRWDRGRIEQIVASLLSNAIKYSPGKPIQVRVTSEGEQAEIAVADRGLGIAAEDIDRIFGRFERAVSARQYGGLGLGLYIARQLARAHGGDIVVESRLGEGATFTVRLPIGASAVQSAPAASKQPILLVDDDQDIREVIAELLIERGFAVQTAENGRAALDLARERRPRVILLDMMMPDMDGWAFMTELRKSPELASIPVVVLSAHDAAAEIAASLNVAGCVKKPFELAELLETLERSTGVAV